MQLKGPMKVMGSTEVKRPTEVNFKQGEHQIGFVLSLLSQLQNDGATVECSTLVSSLLQIQLTIICF